MLTIVIPATEGWDEENECFTILEEAVELKLEHSLVSVSKWESEWCKPFLTRDDKTSRELMDYIKFMTLTKDVDPKVYNRLTEQNVEAIKNYIDAPRTATTISTDKNGKPNREIVTSELIYYWMIALCIPFECQHWHLNRLLTLVKVCNIKNAPAKKRKSSDTASKWAAINAARRKNLNTRG